jgi:hypothetical protein
MDNIVKSFAIIVGDNDYSMTFLPLLETITRYITWKGKEETITKDEVENLIRDGIEYHYKTFQKTSNSCDSQYTIEYLLNVIRIIFNNAANEDFLTVDHDYGAYYISFSDFSVKSY